MTGLTLAEAADRLGITTLELDHLRHASPLPIRMVKIERRILYDPELVDDCRKRWPPRLLSQLARHAGRARLAEAAAQRAARSRRRADARRWMQLSYGLTQCRSGPDMAAKACTDGSGCHRNQRSRELAEMAKMELAKDDIASGVSPTRLLITWSIT